MIGREVTLAILFAVLFAVLVHPVIPRAQMILRWWWWRMNWVHRRPPTVPPTARVYYLPWTYTAVAATCRCTGGTSPIVPTGRPGGEHVCISCGEAYTAGGQRLGYMMWVIHSERRSWLAGLKLHRA